MVERRISFVYDPSLQYSFDLLLPCLIILQPQRKLPRRWGSLGLVKKTGNSSGDDNFFAGGWLAR
jgi:hypothetical protein